MHRKLWSIGLLFILTVSVFPTLASDAGAATEDYEGAYICSFAGDMAGSAIVQVSSSGALEGVIWVEQQNTVDYVAGWASVDDAGAFSFSSWCGMQVEGTISASGEISGFWDYETYSGTLSGQLDTGSLDAYAGSYSVSITGDVTGLWSMVVDSSGNITGEFQSSDEDVYLGMVDSQGNIICITDEGTSAKGTIDADGNISGTWYSQDGYSGTFTNQTSSSDGGGGDGGGGGGGGGGCFLSTLLTTGRFWPQVIP